MSKIKQNIFDYNSNPPLQWTSRCTFDRQVGFSFLQHPVQNNIYQILQKKKQKKKTLKKKNKKT